MVLFGGFAEGKWTPDLAILLAEIVFKQIIAIGMAVKIKNMKLFMNDQGNNKFRREFGKFKMMKEKGKMDASDTSKAEQFAEEIKQELESQESSGLMTKEIE